jgi:hypothetical protein
MRAEEEEEKKNKDAVVNHTAEDLKEFEDFYKEINGSLKDELVGKFKSRSKDSFKFPCSQCLPMTTS